MPGIGYSSRLCPFLYELQLWVGSFSFVETLTAPLLASGRSCVIEFAGGELSHLNSAQIFQPCCYLYTHPYCSSVPRKLSKEQTRMSWGSSFKLNVSSLLSPYVILFIFQDQRKLHLSHIMPPSCSHWTYCGYILLCLYFSFWHLRLTHLSLVF